MTITGMKKAKPESAKPMTGLSVAAALASGAARILPLVKLPVWMETELAQAIMAEASRHQQGGQN
jgi:hypothetical protein